MGQTSKMQFVTPSEGDEPFFDLINSFFNALDASLFAGREDRNLFLEGGGTVTVVFGGGPMATITWTQSFILKGFEGSGEVHVLAASAVISPGSPALFVTIPRPAQIPPPFVTAAPQVGNFTTVGHSDANIVIAAFGSDGKVYFRNGASVGSSGGVSGSTDSIEEYFTAAAAQQLFIPLTHQPLDSKPFNMYVHRNGVYEENANVSVSGPNSVTVNWDVPCVGGEDVAIAYRFSV